MPDLPPRRRSPSSGSGPWSQWTRPLAERLTPAVRVLVISSAVLYGFYTVVRPSRALFEAHLALGPRLFEGEVWQPVTSLFVHFDFIGFVFNLIGLWFVGAFIERTHGTRKFLQIFFGAGILSNLATVGVAQLVPYRAAEIFDGPSAAIMALFVVFGRQYGRAQAQILPGLVMQARYLTWLLLGLAVVAGLFSRDWPRLAGTLTAAAVGYFMGGGGFGEIMDSLRGLRARRWRRRYRVLDGGQSPSRRPKYWN